MARPNGAMVLARVKLAHLTFARVTLARILVISDTYPQCLLARVVENSSQNDPYSHWSKKVLLLRIVLDSDFVRLVSSSLLA
jgi:hypothetical protein